MKKRLSFFTFFIILSPLMVLAQGFKLPKNQKFEKISFQLINNLIIIPLEINGEELTFVLDSGVRKPILFNISETDSLQINDVSEITIRGLGDGEPMKALSSKGNVFKLGKARNSSQGLFVVLDKEINFSTSLGIPVHGILGFDLFRDFVVEVNYNARYLKLHNPDKYEYKNHKNAQTLPLSIERTKAY
ncbi:MAG: retropepsin-like aspartic protease, partial [Flavobacteriaceae bacterium]